MSLLPLSPDELLTTTRAVRKRLDFDRPVERSVIEECLQIAIQAPTGSNLQRWHFVVVTDQAKRRAIAELYRKSWATYLSSPTAATNLRFDDPTRDTVQQRVGDSAQYLADHLERAPVFLIPCFVGRVDGQPSSAQAGHVGLDLAGRLELHAGRARPRPRHGLDHDVPAVRARGRRDPRDPVRAVHPGCARPGGLHARHGLQARASGAAGERRALGQLVSRRAPGDAVRRGRRGRPVTPRARSAHRRWRTGR